MRHTFIFIVAVPYSILIVFTENNCLIRESRERQNQDGTVSEEGSDPVEFNAVDVSLQRVEFDCNCCIAHSSKQICHKGFLGAMPRKNPS